MDKHFTRDEQPTDLNMYSARQNMQCAFLLVWYLLASTELHDIGQVTTIYIPWQQTKKMHRPNTNIPQPKAST